MIGISMSARAGTRQPFEWDRLFVSTIVRGRGIHGNMWKVGPHELFDRAGPSLRWITIEVTGLAGQRRKCRHANNCKRRNQG